MKIFIIIVIILIVIVALAMTIKTKSHSKVAEIYADKIASTPQSYKKIDIEKKFQSLYENLKVGANEKTIRETYAKNVYFNDTLTSIDNIEDLIKYMTHAASVIKSTTVEIQDIAISETDYYVRWVMVMEFRALGKDIYSKSIGMSQLRFDQEGKIIFHQDFWDSTEGFYQHLPYIGYLVRKVREKL